MPTPTAAPERIAHGGNGNGFTLPTYRDPGEPPPWLSDENEDLSSPWPIAPQPVKRAQPMPPASQPAKRPTPPPAPDLSTQIDDALRAASRDLAAKVAPDAAIARLHERLAQIRAGRPTTRSRLALHGAIEAWETLPPREWVIEGLIGAGDVVLFFGDAGLGKTYVLTDAAICVATGEPWLGRATSGAPVLIIDEESGHRRLTDRLSRTMRGHGIAPGTPVAVSYACMIGVNFLADPTWYDELTATICDTGARLVIVDALADIALGGDENSVRDMQPILHGLRTVAEQTGAAIVVIHHANRSGTGYRGSSAINGAVDLALQVSRGDAAGTLKIESVKARDIEPVTFACRPTWDAITETFCLAAVEARPAGQMFGKGEKYILRYLWEHPNGAGKREIENHADVCSAGTARNSLYALVSKGFAKRTDEGGSGDAATFALTATGKSAARDLA